MLFDDQRAAQRNHHQNAEQAAQHRHQQHAANFQIEAQDHDGGHGDADAERDRFAGRTRSLDDVVFQNGSVLKTDFRHQPEQA